MFLMLTKFSFLLRKKFFSWIVAIIFLACQSVFLFVSVWIWKSLRGLCVSFSRTSSGFIIIFIYLFPYFCLSTFIYFYFISYSYSILLLFFFLVLNEVRILEALREFVLMAVFGYEFWSFIEKLVLYWKRDYG